MCIRTKMRAPLRAGRDIYCYKVLILDRPADHLMRFLSPVTFHEYLPDRKMRLGADQGFRMENVKPEGEWMNISYGFHSYIRRPVVTPEEWKNCRYVVAKCRIPRGSWYWKGNRGGWGQEEYDEYCSDHIELVAWLDPESGEWRRPKYRVHDWPESSDISLLNGMTLDEAQDRMSERYEMHCFHGDRSRGRFWFGAKGKNIPYTGYVVWLMVNNGIVTGQW